MSDHVELFKDANESWRWRRRAANGKIVATSGEGYSRRIDCLEEAENVNPGLEVREVDE